MMVLILADTSSTCNLISADLITIRVVSFGDSASAIEALVFDLFADTDRSCSPQDINNRMTVLHRSRIFLFVMIK